MGVFIPILRQKLVSAAHKNTDAVPATAHSSHALNNFFVKKP